LDSRPSGSDGASADPIAAPPAVNRKPQGLTLSDWLTVENLAAAIHEAVNNPELRRKTATVGGELRAENGVRIAVQRLEAIMRSSPDGKSAA